MEGCHEISIEFETLARFDIFEIYAGVDKSINQFYVKN